MSRHDAAQQRGATLIVVLLLLLLASALTLGGLRLLLIEQTIVSNEADRQRSFAAAQTLLADAQADVVCQSCRATGAYQPPTTREAFTLLQAAVSTSPLGCAQAICAPRHTQTRNDRFWTNVVPSSAFWASGATLGQYTTTQDDSGGSLAGDASRARYWIEVWMNGTDATASPAVVYRITAVAIGLKPGTRVVLQSLFLPPTSDAPARRVGWRELTQ